MMHLTNRTTCPDCGKAALRTIAKWWKQLFLRGHARYHCRSCGKHFLQNG